MALLAHTIAHNAAQSCRIDNVLARRLRCMRASVSMTPVASNRNRFCVEPARVAEKTFGADASIEVRIFLLLVTRRNTELFRLCVPRYRRLEPLTTDRDSKA